MNNKAFVVGAFTLALAVFFAFAYYNKTSSKPTSTQSQAPASDASVFVKPHSPSYGTPLSRVLVVEWFDPECESCRVVHKVVKQIIADYSDRVHIVLRYMPFHSNSLYAASVLEEAKEMGKFEQALDILFEKQPEWGSHHEPRPDLIPTYLAEIGIPKEKLDRDYVIKKHGEKIKIDELDGRRVGVRGTPTFFVNGKMLEQLGERPLRDAIDRALAQ